MEGSSGLEKILCQVACEFGCRTGIFERFGKMPKEQTLTLVRVTSYESSSQREKDL